MANQLSQSGFSQGIVIKLQCSCPSGCKCNSTAVRKWHHKVCGCPSFINEFGDIFCKNYQRQTGLLMLFHLICMSFKGAAQFQMALTQAFMLKKLQGYLQKLEKKQKY